MRHRLLLVVAIAGVSLSPLTPSISAQTASQQDAAEEQSEFRWHLINSLIFAVGLGYAIWKLSPAFFNARSADINKAIQEATGLKMQADFRHSDIDRKMAELPQEIQRMREEARVHMDREERRRHDETRRELQKIEEGLQAEIARSRAAGELGVQRRTALLALDSAEQQLRQGAAVDKPASW